MRSLSALRFINVSLAILSSSNPFQWFTPRITLSSRHVYCKLKHVTTRLLKSSVSGYVVAVVPLDGMNYPIARLSNQVLRLKM
ncbi:hypothetical protein [Vibrio phage vB_VpaP_C2]|nr:hypothetical protein [Vibrio phage vB_VpaP_C2]USL89968.1 hypothetical protein [Vibrio phage vB_VpaP_M3]